MLCQPTVDGRVLGEYTVEPISTNDPTVTTTLVATGSHLVAAFDSEFESGRTVVTDWPLEISDLVAAACKEAGRNLSHDEWKQYVGDFDTYEETCPGLPLPSAATPHAAAARPVKPTSRPLNVAKKPAPAAAPRSVTTVPVPVRPPTAPMNVTAVGDVDRATIRWTAPAADNGSAITGYVITPYLDGVAQPAQTFMSTAVTETVTGLTPGKTYTFTVVAKNGNGTGPQSTASNAVTVGAPVAPKTAVTTAAGTGSASVHWTAPATSNGSAITGYAPRRR